ncbi:MAG: hypothetical protein NC900_04350, partial [Candidatus Omnitrophica bacterium]|nr:hypothetical protein [Candidatus Omnitrophota bacterium]
KYYTPLKLTDIFKKTVGPTSISVDGFFSLNPDDTYIQILPFYYRFLLFCSTKLRYLSKKIKFLIYLADSLYLKSFKI